MSSSRITPVINTAPEEKFQLSHRMWQGCPSILRTPKGRLFAGWVSGGSGEASSENYNLLVRSDDEGWTWSRPLTVISSDMSKDYFVADFQLWLDPLNRMWGFIIQRYLGGERRLSDADHLALWAVICDDPDADEIVWSEPRYITNGFLRNQPTVLSNGDWIMCAYNWYDQYYHYCRSKDQGETWTDCRAGRKQLPDYDEAMLIERRDGTLLMFARDIRPLIVKCESDDLEGSNWSDGTFTKLLSANSRFYLRRLKSGKVILIHNDAADCRRNLTVRLSDDDGDTWPWVLRLDDSCTNISYPDAVESDDGRIFIIYDKERFTKREIVMAQITEDDIINGSIIREDSYLQRIISKAPVPKDQQAYQGLKVKEKARIKELFLKLCRDNDLFMGRIKI